MHDAMDTIYRRHSPGYQHAYSQTLQLLDVDMTGMPCGKKGDYSEDTGFLSSCTSLM